MTNYDKFFEVFKLFPITTDVPFKCNPALDCANCDAKAKDGCNPQKWWDSEFREVINE